MIRQQYAQPLTVRGLGITFGPVWVLVAPLILVILALVYVPIMAPFLSSSQAWGMALVMFAGIVLSQLGHTLGHLAMARALKSDRPEYVAVHIFGDASQAWPAAPTPWREVFIAVAGPTANVALALLAYIVWDLQLHPYLDVTGLFLSLYNLGVTLVNVAPGFPFDGGRLTRALVWGLVRRPAYADLVARRLGLLVTGLVTMWGVALLLRDVRFGLETGAGVLIAAGLLAWALWRTPAQTWRHPSSAPSTSPAMFALRTVVTVILIGFMLAVTVGLLPVVNGIEAPGSAHRVEPMIEVPPDYRHAPDGNFYLTTVITQTPILFAQLIHAHLSPTVKVVSPERIVPPNTTPQEFMELNYRLLEDSETAATIVGMQLAGYDVEILGQGVEVVNILPESQAGDVLQPGDLIVAMNGRPVPTVERLIAMVEEHSPGDTIRLRVHRDVDAHVFTVPLMPGPPPRIGISVRTVGMDIVLPLALTIQPQKIVGGPSAGLMFTLTVYNLLTPGDLTGGWPIAGTGTISLEGTVGPIGGVEQKVAAAERAGVAYFLVPPENYADARRVARTIQVVEIASVDEALDFLRSLPPRRAE